MSENKKILENIDEVHETHGTNETTGKIPIKENPLLNQIRANNPTFATISLIFGIVLAFCFYKAGIGINLLAFIIVMVGLLIIVMNRLSLPIKKGTWFYYGASLLLGISSMLTSNGALHFLNIIGMMLLLDISLLNQFAEGETYDFLRQLGRMLSLPFSTLASIGMPFSDTFSNIKTTKIIKSNKVKGVLIGAFLAIPLLLILVALLSSADIIFGEITANITKFIFSPNIISVTLIIIIGFIACYSIICAAAKRFYTGKEKTREKEDPTIPITTMTIITAVYLVFCTIQIMYLFNNGLFVLPKEFTFAQYARRGFFELLLVTVINIGLIVICSSIFKEHKALKAILTIMTICTYIMIFSAAYRMLLYTGAYHLTFSRLLVLLFLIIDFFVLAGVIISVYNNKFPLFNYCVVITTVFYMGFSLSKPDIFIADYNFKHMESADKVDMNYLTYELSYDAAPLIISYVDEIKNQITSYERQIYTNYLNEIIEKKENRGIRDFNLSIKRASDKAKEYYLE